MFRLKNIYVAKIDLKIDFYKHEYFIFYSEILQTQYEERFHFSFVIVIVYSAPRKDHKKYLQIHKLKQVRNHKNKK